MRKLLVGLIGAGIGRSLTPAMQEEEARCHGLRLHYQLIDLDRARGGAAALPSLLAAARAMGFAGLNITYPCKQAVLPLLDGLSDEARAMAAVNTVVFEHDDDGHCVRSIGCATADGGHMAVGQAVGAFELFTGLSPEATRMEAHFRRLIAGAR